jgi:hypothetical protein
VYFPFNPAGFYLILYGFVGLGLDAVGGNCFFLGHITVCFVVVCFGCGLNKITELFVRMDNN